MTESMNDTNRLYLGSAMESQDGKTEAKTSAHTPGPWRVAEVRIGEMTAKVVSVDGHVAQVWSGRSPNMKTVRANARLVAAAPDLLAACEAQLDSFRQTVEAIAADSPWLLTRIREHANRAESQAHAAIARARGK